MGRGTSLGRDFGWLWAAYAASTAGTWLAFDAFPIIAVRVLHSSAAEVSLLAAAGLAVGALVAVPLGPWVEFRRKRPVMVAMDLLRFLAMMSVPVAYAFGALTFAQLVAVSVLVAAGGIVFAAASGAHLKALVPPESLLRASTWFESTSWTATTVGPPLGGAAIGIFGPMTTVVVDSVSYLLSALGIRGIRGNEPPPPARPAPEEGAAGLGEGWRYLLRHPQLRGLFFSNRLIGGLILATAPLLAVLLLRDLHMAPWQYGLAFGAPCLGGLAGSRLARPLVARFGQHRVMLATGTVRACWPIGLAFTPPGPAGLLLVIGLQFGLVTSMGIFNPVFAAYRLQAIPPDRLARVLSAYTISSRASTAALTFLWGLLAALTSARTAILIAGVLILATPLLLPRHAQGAVPRARRWSPRPARSRDSGSLLAEQVPCQPGHEGRRPERQQVVGSRGGD